MQWFSVDRVGLSKVASRRSLAAAVWELVSNSLDAPGTTRVDVFLERIPSSPFVTVRVTDDSPEGFVDLSHAWTLYAESSRKGDAEKRGRFNLGEKLVLALCRQARIETTSGTVVFDDVRPYVHKLHAKRAAGTEFAGEIQMTRDQLQEVVLELRKAIVPAGVDLWVNGESIGHRVPAKTVEATLATEIADAEGFLRRSTRKAKVEIYKLEPGETAHLYELGIPVVETGDQWHVNVCQKVPLNVDRDNVPPSFLTAIRALVLNVMIAEIKGEQAAAPWVRAATESKDAAPEAVVQVVKERFGERFVGWDPTDHEANSTAEAAGFKVIPPAALSKLERDKVKEAGAWQRAGELFPTHGAKTTRVRSIPESEWTDGMKVVADWSRLIARRILGKPIGVSFFDSSGTMVSTIASYCKKDSSLSFNVHLMSDLCTGSISEGLDDLLLHELAHEYSDDHRSYEYHEACTRLGARLAHLLVSSPEILADYHFEPFQAVRPDTRSKPAVSEAAASVENPS